VLVQSGLFASVLCMDRQVTIDLRTGEIEVLRRHGLEREVLLTLPARAPDAADRLRRYLRAQGPVRPSAPPGFEV
jgi:hypothetical protein